MSDRDTDSDFDDREFVTGYCSFLVVILSAEDSSESDSAAEEEETADKTSKNMLESESEDHLISRKS